MPTALQLGPKGWKRYLQTNKHRFQSKPLPSQMNEEYELLLGRIREVADELRRRFDVQRIVLFGSIAHKAWFTSGSDVDLAVEGLNVKDYWDAWKVAEDILVGRTVDLIEIEKAKPSLKQSIIRTGIEL